MKKAISVLLCIVFLFMFVSCGNKADTSLWQANETFENVTVYKYGDVISANFADSCSIKIKDNSYDHFVKYVNDLKEGGFSFFSTADVPENINLYEGAAHWRCSDGKVWLQLIFSEDGSETYSLFDCNLQIYGYSEKPENW